MSLRKIVTIDTEKCNGCGACITACAEGALALVNGKARIVKEQFCDGFGDCLGECPTGALKIVEKDCDDFDEQAVKTHLEQSSGREAVERMENAAARHLASQSAEGTPVPAGCPGTRMRTDMRKGKTKAPATSGVSGHVNESDLEQWPVQIHLVQPGAPFFKGRELVVLSTCSPIASADVHWRYIRGRGVVVGCPKLDRVEGYAEKLGAILGDPTIPKVIVVRMEVPCCGGLTAIVREAVDISGRTDLEFEEVTIAVDGDVRS